MGKLSRNQKGFGAVETILIVIIVGIIGGTGWYVYSVNKSINASDANTLKSSTTTPNSKNTASGNKYVELSSTKLPEGWSVDVQNVSLVNVSNKTIGCSVSVSSTTDTAESNSPSVNHDRQTIDAIKSKAYSVEELAKGKLELLTNNDTNSLDSLEINISLEGDSSSQSYGFISTADRFTSVQASCTNRNDLSIARLALKSIKINL